MLFKTNANGGKVMFHAGHITPENKAVGRPLPLWFQEEVTRMAYVWFPEDNAEAERLSYAAGAMLAWDNGEPRTDAPEAERLGFRFGKKIIAHRNLSAGFNAGSVDAAMALGLLLSQPSRS